MASSGTLIQSAYGLAYTFSWAQIKNDTNNTSTINWSLVCAAGSGVVAERTLILTAGGNTLIAKTDRVMRGSGKIGEGSFVIAHDANGEASFTATLQVAVYTSSVNINAAQTWVLENTARLSTLTLPSDIKSLGESFDIKVTKSVPAYYHRIWWECGSKSGWITDGGIPEKDITTFAFNDNRGNKVSLATENTTSQTVPIKFYIQTYADKTTKIGSPLSYEIRMFIPNVVGVLPIVKTLGISDNTGTYDKYKAYVKGMSELKVAVTPECYFGAHGKSYSVTVNGTKFVGANIIAPCQTAGEITIKGKVIDTRGKESQDSGEAVKTVTVLDYKNPTIKANVKRVASSGSTDEVWDGKWCMVTMITEISDLNGKNPKNLSLAWKDDLGQKGSAKLEASAYGTATTRYWFQAESARVYSIDITVSDGLGSASVSKRLSTAFCIIHFRPEGKSIGFGGVVPTTEYNEDKYPNGLSAFYMDTNFHGQANFDGGINIDGKDINAVQRSTGFTPDSSRFKADGTSYVRVYKGRGGTGLAVFNLSTATSISGNALSVGVLTNSEFFGYSGDTFVGYGNRIGNANQPFMMAINGSAVTISTLGSTISSGVTIRCSIPMAFNS